LSEQFPLLFRSTDPEGSRAAARKARPRANSDAGKILRVIEAFPGLLARDLAKQTGIDAYIVRKRTADLRRLGLARSVAAPAPHRELRWFPSRA